MIICERIDYFTHTITTITAVLTEIKEIKEIRLSYSLEFIAHVILEKQSANVPKGTKKKLQESYLSHVFCLRNLRDLRETLGFLLSTLTCLFSRR